MNNRPAPPVLGHKTGNGCRRPVPRHAAVCGHRKIYKNEENQTNIGAAKHRLSAQTHGQYDRTRICAPSCCRLQRKCGGVGVGEAWGGAWEAGFAAPVEVILFLFVQQRGGGCSLGLGGGGGKV